MNKETNQNKTNVIRFPFIQCKTFKRHLPINFYSVDRVARMGLSCCTRCGCYAQLQAENLMQQSCKSKSITHPLLRKTLVVVHIALLIMLYCSCLYCCVLGCVCAHYTLLLQSPLAGLFIISGKVLMFMYSKHKQSVCTLLCTNKRRSEVATSIYWLQLCDKSVISATYNRPSFPST